VQRLDLADRNGEVERDADGSGPMACSHGIDTLSGGGFATFYSRSRQKLWMKGETSGNKLAVQQILVDCDDDTVLVKVKRMGDGNVCHTGARTCFRVFAAD
jgi:phosphoribosyl-AMP cyclohydrolase